MCLVGVLVVAGFVWGVREEEANIFRRGILKGLGFKRG